MVIFGKPGADAIVNGLKWSEADNLARSIRRVGLSAIAVSVTRTVVYIPEMTKEVEEVMAKFKESLC